MVTVPDPKPKLMVIGDSLAQGCRSLSITRTLCEQSWPARLARVLGWTFTTPDLPRPILFDLEAEVRRVDTLTLSVEQCRIQGFTGRLRANLAEWLAGGGESASASFDNLALAGAKIHDLYTRTASSSSARIAELTPEGAATAVPIKGVGDLHISINGRFTLNPSQNPAFDNFSALDWVRERKPELLVVQIGHNHGLYEVGSRAVAVEIDQEDTGHGTYWAQWTRLA